MALGARALVSLADQKTYCGISDSSQDGILEMLIDSVSDIFNCALGRILVKATYTDVYYDGNGEPDLLLPHYPIVAVSSLIEDGATLTEGIDNDYVWYASEGRLHKNGGTWVKGPKTIKITYEAGYVISGTVTLPNDLKLAALMQIAAEWKRHQLRHWGETSRSHPDGSTTREAQGLLREVKDILNRYLDYRP